MSYGEILRFRMKSRGVPPARHLMAFLTSLVEGLVAVRRDSRLSILVCLFCICFIPLLRDCFASFVLRPLPHFDNLRILFAALA
jgi:hypothetical protein